MNDTAVYPGSFDPITNGHLDLLERGLKIFDKIIVAVAVNPGKNALFNLQERYDMVEAVTGSISAVHRVKVDVLSGLLVDYAKAVHANAILRGLRALSDFEYESQMALMNCNLCAEVETFFIMTAMQGVYISSSLIKQIAMSGGCVSGLVPELVEKRLLAKITQNRKLAC
jgi:pantetheine-phosphate adenylyltransferase